jgi:hypothetical protein
LLQRHAPLVPHLRKQRQGLFEKGPCPGLVPVGHEDEAGSGERHGTLVRRAGRTLAAAQAQLQAGGFGKALELLAGAEAGPLDEPQSARVDWLRGQVAYASGQGSDAPPLLLKAARQFEPLDPDLARETYLDAWQAAHIAGHLAGGGDLDEVSRAARALPPLKRPPRPADLLLDGLTLLVTDGPAPAASVLRQAASAFVGPDVPGAQLLRWGRMALVAGTVL